MAGSAGGSGTWAQSLQYPSCASSSAAVGARAPWPGPTSHGCSVLSPVAAAQPLRFVSSSHGHSAASHGHSAASHGHSAASPAVQPLRFGSASHGHSAASHGHSAASHGHSAASHYHSVATQGHSVVSHGHSVASHGHSAAFHGHSAASPAAVQPPRFGSASHGHSAASPAAAQPLRFVSASHGHSAASPAAAQPLRFVSASHGHSAASPAAAQPLRFGSASHGHFVASPAAAQPPRFGSAPHGHSAASPAAQPLRLGSASHGHFVASPAAAQPPWLGYASHGHSAASLVVAQPPRFGSSSHRPSAVSPVAVQPPWLGSAFRGHTAASPAAVQPPGFGPALHGNTTNAPAVAQLPGFEAFGKLWEVQAQLGTGSSATVFRVSTGTGAQATAVKEFQSDPHNGEYGFRKESSTLEDLQGHKNIVTLYGVFTNHLSVTGPTRCLLLELLDVSVSELLLHASHQGCSMWTIQHCARDVLQALAFIHREGYVHADLKPRNVLWSGEEECFKLIDFGLSFKDGNQDVKYIQTEGYRAPEAEQQNFLAQAGLHSDLECTSAVDLWSLGIVLLEMYSGIKLKHAVRSQEWKANSSVIIDHIFSSKGVVNAAIPAYHLRDLIKSMLRDDPRHRITAEKALCSPFFSIPFAPHIEDLVMLPTPVLRLLNVLDERYLQVEEEYEDVVEDMREECQKYGPVVSLFVPKENPGKGQVFVEYANAGDSKAARKMLSGRIFDGRFVVATFYPLSAYKKGYLYQTLL